MVTAHCSVKSRERERERPVVNPFPKMNHNLLQFPLQHFPQLLQPIPISLSLFCYRLVLELCGKSIGTDSITDLLNRNGFAWDGNSPDSDG